MESWHRIGEPSQKAFVESLNGHLIDKLLNEMVTSLANANAER